MVGFGDAKVPKLANSGDRQSNAHGSSAHAAKSIDSRFDSQTLGQWNKTRTTVDSKVPTNTRKQTHTHNRAHRSAGLLISRLKVRFLPRSPLTHIGSVAYMTFDAGPIGPAFSLCPLLCSAKTCFFFRATNPRTSAPLECEANRFRGRMLWGCGASMDSLPTGSAAFASSWIEEQGLVRLWD